MWSIKINESPVPIPKCLGGPEAGLASLSYASKDFEKIKVPQPETKELLVDVYTINNPLRFRDIPTIFNRSLKDLKFDSQEQIKTFITQYPSFLEGWYWGTVFYFEEKMVDNTDNEQGWIAFFNYKDGHSLCYGYQPSLRLGSINEVGSNLTNYTQRIVIPTIIL